MTKTTWFPETINPVRTESRQIELRPGDMVFACYHREGLAHYESGANAVLCYVKPDAGLEDVVDAFTDWLRGCGFVFDGRLEVVND
jgi:hypothetical protein